MTTTTMTRPRTLAELREWGWVSKPVKRELRDNLMAALARDEDLFPGIIGYDDTVIPEIINAIIAGHDMLFLGEKGQAKSRLMRLLARFLDEEIPYLDIPRLPGPRGSATSRSRGPAASSSASHRRARHSDRLVAARASLRRATGPGHQVRRHHRRDRPGQARRAARACPPRRRCTSG